MWVIALPVTLHYCYIKIRSVFVPFLIQFIVGYTTITLICVQSGNLVRPSCIPIRNCDPWLIPVQIALYIEHPYIFILMCLYII